MKGVTYFTITNPTLFRKTAEIPEESEPERHVSGLDSKPRWGSARAQALAWQHR